MVLNQDSLDSTPGELQVEPWFETHFKAVQKTQLPTVNGFSYNIIAKNELIPKNIDLHCRDDAKMERYTETVGGQLRDKKNSYPVLLTDKGHDLYYVLDTQFKTPKLKFDIAIRLPTEFVNETAEKDIYLEVFIHCLSELINTKMSALTLAGISYAISDINQTGIQMNFFGFSDTLMIAVKRVIQVMKETIETGFPERELKMSVEMKQRKLKNEDMMPMDQIENNRNLLLYSNFFHCKQKHQILSTFSKEKFDLYTSKFFTHGKIQYLFYGNFDQDQCLVEADAVTSLLRSIVPTSDFTTPIERTGRVHLYPQGSLRWDAISINPSNKNNGIAIQCMFENEEDEVAQHEKKVALDVLDTIMSENFFDTLRTKQQLGYTVYSSQHTDNTVLRMNFCIESAKYQPDELERRIRDYLKGFKVTYVKELSEQKFADSIKGMIMVKSADFESLKKESKFMFKQVMKEKGFDGLERDVAVLKRITLQQFQDFIEREFYPEGKTMREAVFTVRSQVRKSSIDKESGDLSEGSESEEEELDDEIFYSEPGDPLTRRFVEESPFDVRDSLRLQKRLLYQ